MQIAITPDGATALVTSFDNAVNFIDLSSNKVSFTLMTDGSINPNGIAISPDGTRAYVTSFNPFNPVIAVIDLSSRKVIATIPTTMQYPSGETLTPDGSQLWVTDTINPIANVFDTLTNTLITQLNVGPATDVAFNSTGTRAYITSDATSPGKVLVYDTATLKMVSSYTVGQTPSDISMMYGDRYLVVNNTDGNSISVIDLNSGTVSTTQIGGTPSGISWVR